jgi:hypothetical protein
VRRIGLLLLVVLGGCRACKNEHPYVPYAIDDEASVDEAGTAVEQDAGASFAEIPADRPPPNASQWKIGGLDLAAPAGSIFVLGVARDLDGDGSADGLAIVRKADDPTDAGSVVFYPKGAAPNVLVAPKIASSNCPLTQRLGVVGPHSAFVELGLGCPAQSSREPSRYIAMLGFGKGARVQLEAGILDPTGSAKLGLEADGTDRDNDGYGDVLVAFTLEGGEAPFEPGPKTKARVIWFDKPAGLSREPDEPDASLRGVASSLALRAKSTKDAPAVPPAARQIRALYRALCSEGGSPRLVRPKGDALLSCGTSKGLEEAALAEVRAAVTNQNTLLAIGVLDRAQKAPATKTAARTTEASGWITTAAPVANSTDAPRQVAAVPAYEKKAPSWSALSFDPSGKLLVRTAAGVVRVDPATGDETDAPDVRSWDLAVLSPNGTHRLLEVYNACDGVSLHATLGPGSEQDLVDVPLPIAPPLGTSRCGGAKGEPASAIPLSWGAGGLEAVIAGEPMLVTETGRASALAQPTSHHAIVVPTALGIWAWNGTKARLLRAPALDGTYGQQRDCAISEDGTRAACISGGRAWVAQFPAP